jgi:hypothetical protein
MKTDKWNELRQAIISFEKSNRWVSDYMTLFIVLYRVMKQDSGLIWSDVESATDSALREVG